MPEILPILLTESEAAAYLQIGESTLRRRRRRGQLPPGLALAPCPRRVRYDRRQLERWVTLGCPDVWPAA